MSERIKNVLKKQEGKADSKLPSIILLIIIIVGAFAAYKFVPPYFQKMKFEQEITEILNWDQFHQGSRPPDEKKVFQEVTDLAKKMQVPLKDENLDVKRTEDKPYRIAVNLNYTVEVSLPIIGAKPLQFYIHKVQDK